MATFMKKEIGQIPSVIERQLTEGFQAYAEIGRQLLKRGGPIVTNARGTSDYAAAYFKLLVEIKTGRMVTSLSPSVSSVYNSNLKLDNGFMLSISQSGGSPDLISSQRVAKKGGALTVALTNNTESALAQEADLSVDMLAGEERAVAATKTFAASLLACHCIVRGMQGVERNHDDTPLFKALRTGNSDHHDTSLEKLQKAKSVFTISRGAGLAVAQEAALKLKETCQIHAEAFSAAEVIHGPMVLAKKGIAVIAFETNDGGQDSIENAIRQMESNGAITVRIPAKNHQVEPELIPLIQITHFYNLVEQLSVSTGLDPDKPPMLKKATETT